MKYLLTGDETKRLRLRLLTEQDFDSWKQLFANPNTARFLGLDSKLSAEQLTKRWFDKQFNRYENNLGGMNVLEDKLTGELIGQSGILIQSLNDEERFEIGYSILPKFWKNGYATEAAIHCKNRAFELNFSNSLMSMIHAENIGSELVAKNNGMNLEVHLPNYKGIPVNIYSISKEKWNQ